MHKTAVELELELRAKEVAITAARDRRDDAVQIVKWFVAAHEREDLTDDQFDMAVDIGLKRAHTLLSLLAREEKECLVSHHATSSPMAATGS